MNQELEEQQRLAVQLKDRLQSMEQEERTLTEKIRVLEAKLVVQDLQAKVEVKSEAISQLRNKVKELEARLRLQETAVAEAQPQIVPQQGKQPQIVPQRDKPPRQHF